MRAQGLEIKHRPALTKQQAGRAAHEYVQIASDINVARLVLKPPDAKFAVARASLPSVASSRTLVISRRVRERGFSAQVVPLSNRRTREASVRRSSAIRNNVSR